MSLKRKKLTGDPFGQLKASANSGMFLRVPSTLHLAGEWGSDLSLAIYSAGIASSVVVLFVTCIHTYSGFGSYVGGPDTTKRYEE